MTICNIRALFTIGVITGLFSIILGCNLLSFDFGLGGSNGPIEPYSHDEVIEIELPTVDLSGTSDIGREVITNNSGEKKTYGVTFDSGGESVIWRLYVILSNTTTNAKTTPKISALDVPTTTQIGDQIEVEFSGHHYDHGYSHASHTEAIVAPHIERVHFDDIPLLTARSTRAASPDGYILRSENTFTPHFNRAGDEKSFFLAFEEEYVDATARVVVTDGTQRAVFWTTDDVYAGCVSDCLPTLLEESDIQSLAELFINSEPDTMDIYDRMNSLLGNHWGTQPFDDFLPPSVQQIDVLLYDINDKEYKGGVLGYYWPANSILKSAISEECNTANRSVICNSNERLLVHVHAPWLSLDEGRARDLGAKSQEDIKRLKDIYYFQTVSTLIHEYQHLVYFYQRVVRTGDPERNELGGDGTWFNEQMSLITEDILSQYIFDESDNQNGEDIRGLNDLGAGSYPIRRGRIPQYVYTNSALGVSRWDRSVRNYGVNAAFGAYLLRNYNGSEYIRNVYRSTERGDAAISDALNRHTTGLTMGKAIIRWGQSILLSDSNSAPDGKRTNNGDGGFAFVDSVDNINHKLGSINYYNYGIRNSTTGNYSGALRIYRSTEKAYQELNNIHDGHSNIIVAAAENLNGVGKFKITLEDGQAISVVAKRVRTENNPVFH